VLAPCIYGPRSLLELDLNEKQIPQVIGKNRKASRKVEGSERIIVIVLAKWGSAPCGITDSTVPFRLASNDSQEPFFRSGFPPPGF
jgi:hypothetical protein